MKMNWKWLKLKKKVKKKEKSIPKKEGRIKKRDPIRKNDVINSKEMNQLRINREISFSSILNNEKQNKP